VTLADLRRDGKGLTLEEPRRAKQIAINKNEIETRPAEDDPDWLR